jgi:hypothetical protein
MIRACSLIVDQRWSGYGKQAVADRAIGYVPNGGMLNEYE